MEAINRLNHIQTNPIKSVVNGSAVKGLTPKTMSCEDQFNAAVNVIRRLPKNGPFQPSDEMKLKFYAYYKQATEGPNETRKPPFYDIVNRYKWDAWRKLGDMDKQTAMQSYIDELKKVIETMSFNDSVSEFYEVLGPFYEFLPQEANGETNGSHQISNDKNEKLIESKIKVSKKWTKNSNKDIPQLNGDEENGVESEGEEFSDTYDHIEENGDIPIVDRNGTEFAIEDIMSARGGNGSNPSAQMSSSNTSVNRTVPLNRNRNIREIPSTYDTTGVTTRSGGSGGGGQGSNPQEYSIGINEQLALAVIRLQQSMDQVVNRLDTLESMLSRESRRSQVESSSRLWPFQEMRPQTAIVLMVWPFVAHWVIHYIQNKRRK